MVQNSIIQEIKNISQNSNDENIYQHKIDQLNKELLRLKKGINDSVAELEHIIEEDNA